jgi:hypothetical protein
MQWIEITEQVICRQWIEKLTDNSNSWEICRGRRNCTSGRVRQSRYGSLRVGRSTPVGHAPRSLFSHSLLYSCTKHASNTYLLGYLPTFLCWPKAPHDKFRLRGYNSHGKPLVLGSQNVFKTHTPFIRPLLCYSKLCPCTREGTFSDNTLRGGINCLACCPSWGTSDLFLLVLVLDLLPLVLVRDLLFFPSFCNMRR